MATRPQILSTGYMLLISLSDERLSTMTRLLHRLVSDPVTADRLSSELLQQEPDAGADIFGGADVPLQEGADLGDDFCGD